MRENIKKDKIYLMNDESQMGNLGRSQYRMVIIIIRILLDSLCIFHPGPDKDVSQLLPWNPPLTLAAVVQ